MILELAQAAMLSATGAGAAPMVRLEVPAIRQAPDRCGPAALVMVLRYYGVATAQADSAYDPIFRGALITDLASRARRAGLAARVAALEPDSLPLLLERGVPPILLYQRGVGPVRRGHYGVLVGWHAARGRVAVNDGSGPTRWMARRALLDRWRRAGGQALIVERPGR